MPYRKLPLILLTLALILLVSLKLQWVSSAAVTLLTMLGILITLMTDRYPPALVLFSGLAYLLTASYLSESTFLTADQAFSGFSSSSLVTVGALFVVAQGIRNTGILEKFGQALLGGPASIGTTLRRIALPLASASAVLNNTPIVSIFIPTVREWALKHKKSPSKYLIPLSYFTIFGGTWTLIGTSTNLVVDGFYFQETGTHLPFLGFAWLGIPATIIGILYLTTIGHRLLPQQEDLLKGLQQTAKKYLVEMTIQPNSPLIGQSIEETGFRAIDELFLFEVKRGDRIFAPIRKEFVLEAHDILVFSGPRDQVLKLQKFNGLSSPSHPEEFEIGQNAQFVEVVISHTSPLIGHTINDLWFNRRYNATVLALHRHGHEVVSNLSNEPLRAGDTLLLVAGIGFRRMWQNSTDFFLVSPLRHGGYSQQAAIPALLIIAGMVLLPIFQILPISLTAVLAAVLMTLLHIVKPKNCLDHIDWNVLLVIGAAFGLSSAIKASGGAQLLVNTIHHLVGNASAHVALILIALIASLTTEFITNNAAAALLFPIAIQLSETMQINPLPFAMVLAIAASSSFSTPVGYQTNMMVYGAGGYRYRDYLRVGLPLNLTFTLIPALLAPLVWPF